MFIGKISQNTSYKNSTTLKNQSCSTIQNTTFIILFRSSQTFFFIVTNSFFFWPFEPPYYPFSKKVELLPKRHPKNTKLLISTPKTRPGTPQHPTINCLSLDGVRRWLSQAKTENLNALIKNGLMSVEQHFLVSIAKKVGREQNFIRKVAQERLVGHLSRFKRPRYACPAEVGNCTKLGRRNVGSRSEIGKQQAR